MVYTCCVPNCRSGYRSVVRSEKIPMFRFPKKFEFQQKWFESIPRINWTLSSSHRVCSKHFTEDDFVTFSDDKRTKRKLNRDSILLQRMRVKPTAVPHIFPHFSRVRFCNQFRDALLSGKTNRHKMMAMPPGEPRIDIGSILSSIKTEKRTKRIKKESPASMEEDEIVDIMTLDSTPSENQGLSHPKEEIADIMNLDPTPLKKQRRSYPKKRKRKPKGKCDSVLCKLEDEIADIIMNLDQTLSENQGLSHPKKRKTKPKIKCVRCGYATRDTDLMNNHVVNFHLQLKTFKCNQCDITAVSKRLLEKHQEQTHKKPCKKPDGNATSRQQVCKCGYKTTSFALFRRHFRFNHLQQFPWTCSLCSYVATTELHLRQHVSQNHGEPNVFICGLCGYRADSRRVIKVHAIRKHLTSLNAQKQKSSSRKK